MRDVRNSDKSPTGRLMKKIQCQLKLSVIHPPRVGPTAGATTTAMPYSANAMPALFDGKCVRQDGLLGRLQPSAAGSLQNAADDQHRAGFERFRRGKTSAVNSATQIM